MLPRNAPNGPAKLAVCPDKLLKNQDGSFGENVTSATSHNRAAAKIATPVNSLMRRETTDFATVAILRLPSRPAESTAGVPRACETAAAAPTGYAPAAGPDPSVLRSAPPRWPAAARRARRQAPPRAGRRSPVRAG